MSLTASFIADFSSFLGATEQAKTAMEGLKATAGDLGPEVDQGVQATVDDYIKLGGQIRQTAGEVAQFSQQFIQAYAEEQDAVSHLTAALTAQGQATPEIIAQYEALAAQFQKTTTFADDALLGVESTLTTIGQVGPENLELALTAVTNLASGMKMDLGQAATLVSKALASGGENLGKLKTVMGDTIEPGQEMATTLQQISDKFSGSAAADLQTYNGQVAQLNNQMSDFQETVGKVLVDSLQGLLSAFQSLPGPVQSIIVGVVGLSTALAPVLLSISSLIGLLSTAGLGAGIMTAITSIIAVLTGPVGWIVAAGLVAAAIYKNWDAIVGYTQKLYEGIKTWLVDKFTALVNMIKAPIDSIVGAFQSMYQKVVGGSIVPDMMDGIGQEFGRLDAVMVQPVAEATAQVQAHLQLMAAQMRANAILNRNSLFTTTGQLEEIARVFDTASGGGGGGSRAGSGPVTINNTFNLVDTADNLARQVSDIIMRQIRSGTQLGTA